MWRAPPKRPLGPGAGWGERVLSPAAGGEQGTVCVVVWGWLGALCLRGGSAGCVKPEVFMKASCYILAGRISRNGYG